MGKKSLEDVIVMLWSRRSSCQEEERVARGKLYKMVVQKSSNLETKIIIIYENEKMVRTSKMNGFRFRGNAKIENRSTSRTENGQKTDEITNINHVVLDHFFFLVG